jgi:hypothetical protein
MGIFGFLSKAHNDQNLVSGDVQSKIAIYDEKIKTAKENIESDRKQLKQMDEAVDQVMGRSTDEKGADKANAIRKSQARDRAALAKDIEHNQKLIATLNDEAAPIRAEVRKVEAEVGPIKYIAKFIYGEDGANENMLEKAVTWIIILIVVVFDPLAVIMLLGAQMTFAWHNKGRDPMSEDEELLHNTVPVDVTEVEETPAQEELAEIEEATVTFKTPEEELKEWPFPAPHHSLEENKEPAIEEDNEEELARWNAMIEEAERAIEEENKKNIEQEIARGEELLQADVTPDLERPGDYLTPVTGDRVKPDFTEVIEPEESKKKTYMTKDDSGHTQIKEIK